MKIISDIQNRCEQLALNVSLSSTTKPVIAVCGLLNAGKSYLLNMLTQHIEQEYFKTADLRETAVIKELETDEYIYMDTPGLDANVEDDAVSRQGISKADIVLFVHQPQGELDPAEIAFLRQLINHFGKNAKDSIVIIISKIDKEEPSKVDQIDKAIQKQCQDHLKISFTSIQISNTRYKNGICRHKDGMVRASNIEELLQHLHQITPIITKARRDRLIANIEVMASEVETLMQKRHAEKLAIQLNIRKKFIPFNEEMEQLQVFISKSKYNFIEI